MRRLLITGCQRSGTRFISEMLNGLAIHCGHEQVFHPFLNKPVGMAFWETLPSMRAESSWCAAPFLKTISRNVAILHQVRHPLHNIRSATGIEFFKTPFRPYEPFAPFAMKHCPEAFKQPTEVERALAYWWLWNRMIEIAVGDSPNYARWRVRYIRPIEVVEMLRWALGEERTEMQVRPLFARLGTQANHRARKEDIKWSDIPASHIKEQAAIMARRYGYFELENPVLPEWGA